jgi:hypothetical protein
VPVITSLTDVLDKGKTGEDRCTYALVWLLQNCPPELTYKVLERAGLHLSAPNETFGAQVQYLFADSRPDALLEFSGPRFVIVETKRFADRFDAVQFSHHCQGATKKFGAERVWLLFLSLDRQPPAGLKRLMRPDSRVGFLSWSSLLKFLTDWMRSAPQFRWPLSEFFAVMQREKLWRSFPMNMEELKSFLEDYSRLSQRMGSAEQKLNEILNGIETHVVAASQGRAQSTAEKELAEDLPCIYRMLQVKNWHCQSSAYVFINAAFAKIGLILVGYQDDQKQREAFSRRWNSALKERYKADERIETLTWVDADEDEYSCATGYFKIVSGTKGWAISPPQINDFAKFFYWGYVYTLELDKIEDLARQMGQDFDHLLSTFLVENTGLGGDITTRNKRKGLAVGNRKKGQRGSKGGARPK